MNTQHSSLEGAEATKRLNVIQRLYLKYGKWTGKISAAVLDQAFFAGTNFITNVLLARWLPPEQYGAFVVAYAWFLLPQNLYEAVLIDPLAVFGAGKYSKRFRDYLGYVYYGHLMVSLLVALILGVGAFLTYVLDAELLGIAIAGAALSAPLQLTRLLSRRPFYVISKPHWSAVGGALYLVFTLIGLFWLHSFDVNNTPVSHCLPAQALYRCGNFYAPQMLTPFSALMVMGVAAVVASVALTLILKPRFGVSDETVNTRTVIADHWEYGKWSFGSRILTWLPTNSYFLILPLFGGLSDSGGLRALLNLIMPLNMSLMAVNAILIPSFVRVYENYGRWSLNRRVQLIMRVFAVSTGLYFVAIVVLGKPAISLLYAGAYDDITTYPILIAMGLIPVVNAISTIIRSALQSSGQVKMTFTARIIPTITTMTFGVFLLANFGIFGANLSSLFSGSLSLLILMHFYRIHIKTGEDPVMRRKREAEEAAQQAPADDPNPQGGDATL